MSIKHSLWLTKQISLTIGLCLTFASVFAQDTLEFRSKALTQKWLERPAGFLLQGQTIKSSGTYNLVENIVNSMPGKAKKYVRDTCYLTNQVLVSRCSLKKLFTFYTKLYFPTSKIIVYRAPSHFTIEESRLHGAPDISNLYLAKDKTAALNHDTLTDLHITNVRGWVSLFNNQIGGNIEVTGSDLDQFDITENDFTQSLTPAIQVNQSTFRKFSLSGNNIKGMNLTFANDTINGSFDLNRIDNKDLKTDSGGRINFTFKNCLVNTKFLLAEGTKFISVKFINCTFGKEANFENLYVQQLVFDNCNNFAAPTDLNVIKEPKVDLSFINSDLKNFRLNYLGKFTLFFPDSTKNEDQVSTYENLLAKFKLEGKLESFQNVDIAYTQFKDHNAGGLGAVRGFISKWWWYYSYRKYYILFWTAGLLLLFFWLNIRWWKSVKAVYPIITELPVSKYYNSSSPDIAPERKSYLTILVFTAFIFFSLRINFEKLVYQDRKTLAYFFIQYITGLICVFFIVNAILKIQ